jgi:hypothetical protein
MTGKLTWTREEMTRAYLEGCGLDPSDDAVNQMLEVFLPATALMCGRSSLRGEIWKQSGWRGALYESRKKMHRLWYSWWEGDGADDDSALDLLNYVGFSMRARKAGIPAWGEYGDPSDLSEHD